MDGYQCLICEREWDKLRDPHLSDASNYIVWRRLFRNALTVKARHFLRIEDGDEDVELADRLAARPSRDDLDLLVAIDGDETITLTRRQYLWDFYNAEINSLMLDSIVADSPACYYLDPELTARANWKNFAKRFMPNVTIRVMQICRELFSMNVNKLDPGIDSVAEAIVTCQRQLQELGPEYIFMDWMINALFISLCRQRGMKAHADYLVNSKADLLSSKKAVPCMPFDELRKSFIDAEAQQQLALQEAKDKVATPYSGTAFKVGVPNRRRGGSYQSNKDRGESAAVRGRRPGGNEACLATTVKSQVFYCEYCERRHPWPFFEIPVYRLK